jgi:hypothetical protein
MVNESNEKKVERPYAFAILSGLAAIVLCGGLIFWAWSSPEFVLVGKQGKHDGRSDDRLAGCLDCHVPFIGTPGSRCLSPACHGPLATGTPPQTGPAMPVRFHAALNTIECSQCHQEHDETTTQVKVFSHEIIPEEQRKQCSRCHSGTRQKSHARTNAIECAQCHGIETWASKVMDHRRIWTHACDVCHVAPETTTHRSVAGTCSSCHETTSWKPIVEVKE